MGNAIVVVGYGNVGHHLLIALAEKTDFKITVCSRTKLPDEIVSIKSVQWTANFFVTEKPPDFCFLSVRDDQIKTTAASLPLNWRENSTVIHCSGVLPADYLKDICKHYGLFYPLNSFSKKIPFDWNTVPVFIDASGEEEKDRLKKLALKFGGKAVENDDYMREQLHLTAVMVNNFTNHWFRLAADYLEKKNIPFEYLLPLIRTTVSKLVYENPDKAQTGPAIRGDITTINKHLKMIEEEDLRHLYKKMSASINPNLKDQF